MTALMIRLAVGLSASQRLARAPSASGRPSHSTDNGLYVFCALMHRWVHALTVLCCLFGAGSPAAAQGVSVDALVRAYPDFLLSHNEHVLIWKDGTRMPLSDGRIDKSFEEKLRHASILDQLSLPYPKGPLQKPPGLQEDPGRFRNVAFFDKMYGDCSKGEVQRRLTRVTWLPRSGGGSVEITTVNGVAERLGAVSEGLDTLRP